MENDPWIDANSRIDAKRLYALGVVTLNWNSAEFSLFWLFVAVSGMDIMKARIIVHDMTAPSLATKIRELAAENLQIQSEEQESVEFAMKAFDLCRINRNQFTHFLPSKGKEGLDLYRVKGAAISFDMIPSDIATIRRVAEEIEKTNRFIIKLSTRISDRLAEGIPNRLAGWRMPGPLPDKFPLPEMVWKPPTPLPQLSRKTRKRRS